jgi:hypothetical protein
MAPLTRATIDAEHYVTRYTQGRLNEAELEAFEEYCLLHPELVEQVQTDRMLLSGLQSQPPPRARRFSHPLVFRLAASILIAVFGIAFWRMSLSPSATSAFLYRASDPLPAMLAQNVGKQRRLVGVRDDAARTISVDLNARALPLSIEPARTAGAAEYRVGLAEEIDGKWRELSQLEHVIAEGRDVAAVVVILDLTRLSSPHLRITLSAAGKESDEFTFHVSRDSAPP